MTQGYDAFDDPYAYPGTSVLRNRLGIQDGAVLEAFEVDISTLRAEEPLPHGVFDSAHYCSIHHHLFQDVYEWAGQYRTVRTLKGGNAFCYPEYIPAQMDALFQSIRGGDAFTDKSPSEFLEETARFLGELNAIHPFREGNGRAQLAFLGLIGATANHPFAFERIDRNTFLPAIIDSFLGQFETLMVELEKLLT
ncbi:MAG TPA: Fic family protein [Terracidiphilus sp.]|jgi:cell filamentation protein|nr:Fic family protein [Terracidiphilus sp.]